MQTRNKLCVSSYVGCTIVDSSEIGYRLPTNSIGNAWAGTSFPLPMINPISLNLMNNFIKDLDTGEIQNTEAYDSIT